jgi:hypothetical protein
MAENKDQSPLLLYPDPLINISMLSGALFLYFERPIITTLPPMVWTVYDIQGPAARKTVPLTLYIGLCMLRDGGLGGTDA